MTTAASIRTCFLLFLVIFATFIASWSADARDLTAMNGEEIRALQQRLADAQCYSGAIDGALSPALEVAKRSCPDQEPVLRIETGMHVAAIRSIATDAQCRLVATGSVDKTVRLWSMPDGRLLRTLRLPIGPWIGGMIYTVAVSPDGALVAAAGQDAHVPVDRQHGVYLFDTATGGSIHRIGAFGEPVAALAFSPDGKKLAVGLGKSGIRVLDAANGRELMADTDFSEASYGIAFGPDGTLYAAGLDGFLRHYGLDLQRAAKVAIPGDKKPVSVAVDPSGKRLAVGYGERPSVDIFDAATLLRITAADTAAIVTGDVSKIVWAKDGSIVAGGRARMHLENGEHHFLRRWSANGIKIGADAAVSDNTISSLAPCKDAVLFAAQDPKFGFLRADGTPVTLQTGRTVDARNKLGQAFTVSADATKFQFGLGIGDIIPAVFDLSTGTLRDAPSADAGLTPPQVTGLAVTNWKNSQQPLFAGKPLALEPHETSRSLAIQSDGAGFVLGTEWRLRTFTADGRQLWNRLSPGVAEGVNLAKNGNIIVVAYQDGTIRWHRWADGRELLALFIDKPTRRWVAWTPTGYYMASPGAEDLIGWQVNRGWEQPPDFFPASRFRARFNRPDIVQLVLTTLDENEAVKQANETSNQREETKPIEANLPPVIKILSPERGTDFSASSIELSYALRSPTGLPIDKVDILIDGSPTGAVAPGVSARSANEGSRQTIKIGLPQHDVDVGLVARSGALVSEIAHVKLTYRGKAPASHEAEAVKPVLYALLVGVSNYQDDKLRLAYAANDAQDLATAFKAQTGGLYRDVKVKLLTDKNATVSNVKDGLVWLQKETTSRDLAVVFLAGHGVTDMRNQFWFLPYEADPDRLFSTSVSRTDILGVLHDMPGKKILFLDACHAGAVLQTAAMRTRSIPVDLNSTINDFATADSGLVVYAASTGREFSVENDDWRHGAFTKALLEAIGEGKADVLHNGKITTALLDAYLAERVKVLTDGEQHPVMSRPDAVPDFPLALAK